jgi:hypothetical protein
VIVSEEGNALQAILDSVERLATEIEEAQPGDPELAAIVASVIDLQGRLKRVRSVMGPLVPDAKREPSLDEKAAARLERALASLLSSAEARRDVG